MQNKQGGLGIVIPITLVALASGLFLSDYYSGERVNPVELLMLLERFYRERLANQYASLEVSDKKLSTAVQNLASFFTSKRTQAFAPVQEEVYQSTMEELVTDFNWYIFNIVDETSYFFKSLNNALTTLESNSRLSTILTEKGIFYNVGKLLYTPLNQIIIKSYADLLDETTGSLKNTIITGRLTGPDRDLLNKLVRSLDVASSSLSNMFYYAVEFDRRCAEYTHHACTWTLHTLVEEGKTSIYSADISLPLFFNDVAALVHRYADILSEIQPLEKIKVGHIPVRFATNANQTLLSAVKEWASMVTLLEKRDWPYMQYDLDPLRGTVVDDYAWLRVGSSRGHATHIEKKGEVFTIRYYDQDATVNKLLTQLVSEYVPRSEVNMLTDGVEIKVNNEGNLRRVAKLLAFVTSLDILIEHSSVQAAKNKIEHTIEKLHLLG